MAERDWWTWYCRLCGSSGEHDTEMDRDLHAFQHVAVCPNGTYRTVECAIAGRLMHVWSHNAGR